MPTYEYACSNCGNQWEEIQKISEDAIKECPKCHQQTAQRQISGGNFILKGGGWYADLYSSSKGGSGGGGSSKASSSSESSTKTETKSESTTSSTPAATTPSTGSSSGGSGTKT
ncbi:MAG TPA: zinc ribbon domain-containing protein [Polyangiaceae bacterium]